jgi:tetratricopeptide (TPR) repeat protein
LTVLRRIPAWAAGIFLLALGARLGFLFLMDQPLLYAHQYSYFTNALWIAERSDALRYLVTSDEWRVWDGMWTIAPLYYVFAAGVLKLFGPQLLPLQLIQCTLDALVAVMVALLGRRVAGRWGALAGAAYALHWPAVEMPSWTMTENLHTPLFVAGLVLLSSETLPRRRAAFWGGLVVGVSALTRSVSSAFLGVVALIRVAREGIPKGIVPAVLILAGGATAIVPWLARNLALGQPPMIETAAYENIWWANHFGDHERFRRQQEVVRREPTAEARRAAALHFALRAIREHPDLFLGKIKDNFWHFLRPDWLDSLLRVERPLPAWQNLVGTLTDDVLLMLTLPLFVAFLCAGRPSPTRDVIGAWTAYYLFMIVVVFHNELRYRSALVPFAFAGAAGGLALLRDPERRLRARLGLALGVVLVLGASLRYAAPAARSLRASWALRPALGAAEYGDGPEALRLAEAAAALDPRSPRPWLAVGRALDAAHQPQAAIDAYRRAQSIPKPGAYLPMLALPRLLTATGQDEEARRVLDQADLLSWSLDPWVLLEIAWRDVPAPRADVIDVGRDDYGAVRGFLHPRGGDATLARRYGTFDRPPRVPEPSHRWTRHRAWLRLVPTQAAATYRVTLEMGSPAPSPLQAPEVTVRAGTAAPRRVTLTRAVAAYTFDAPAPRAGQPLVVRIDAPTWTRSGEPAEQGVRVDRLTVAPAGTP